MKSSVWSLLVPLVWVGTTLAAKFPVSSIKNDKATPGGIIPNRFIVELSAPLSTRDLESREVGCIQDGDGIDSCSSTAS